MISGIRLIVSFLILLGIISCQNSNNVSQPQKLSQDQVTEKLVEANKNALNNPFRMGNAGYADWA